MRRLAVALIALTVGCSPAVGVYVSPDEPLALRDATYAAVDHWNDALGVALLDVREDEVTALAYGDLFAIHVVSAERVKGSDDTSAHTQVYGTYTRISVERSFLDSSVSDDGVSPNQCDKNDLLAHEMGHALGLSHDSRENNLMYDFDYWQECATQSALDDKQVRRVRALTGLRSAF